MEKPARIDLDHPVIRWRLRWFEVQHVLGKAHRHGVAFHLDSYGELHLDYDGDPPEAILRELHRNWYAIIAVLETDPRAAKLYSPQRRDIRHCLTGWKDNGFAIN